MLFGTIECQKIMINVIKFTCPFCSHTNRAVSKYCANCGAPAALLQERYIRGSLQPAQLPEQYEAFDLWRCGAKGCGALLVDTDNGRCPQCNTDSPLQLSCRLQRLPTPPLPSQADHRVFESWFYDPAEQSWYAVCRPEWDVDWFPQGQLWRLGAATDPGQNYDHNEDSCLTQLIVRHFNSQPASLALLAVADGIGGHAAGDVASRVAINSLLVAASQSLMQLAMTEMATEPKLLQQQFEQAVLAANSEVYLKHQETESDLGAALTAALIVNGLAVVANVGDCRTYLLRRGELQQITEDHSLVYRYYKQGQISRDEIYTHPENNIIIRSLGDKPQVKVDTFVVKLRPDDHLVLCCDGLWELVRDEAIAAVIAEENDPQVACDRLVDMANSAGGKDNITIIIGRTMSPA
jgi:serine/threonine protein phosphatase PrpC